MGSEGGGGRVVGARTQYVAPVRVKRTNVLLKANDKSRCIILLTKISE